MPHDQKEPGKQLSYSCDRPYEPLPHEGAEHLAEITLTNHEHRAYGDEADAEGFRKKDCNCHEQHASCCNRPDQTYRRPWVRISR
jgi:hypothetical protein